MAVETVKGKLIGKDKKKKVITFKIERDDDGKITTIDVKGRSGHWEGFGRLNGPRFKIRRKQSAGGENLAFGGDDECIICCIDNSGARICIEYECSQPPPPCPPGIN